MNDPLENKRFHRPGMNIPVDGLRRTHANRSGAWIITLVAGVAAALTIAAQTRTPAPLSIARQGYLFAGGTYATVNGRQVMSGQLYAEYQIPVRQSHAWPIVMIHGGSQS